MTIEKNRFPEFIAAVRSSLDRERMMDLAEKYVLEIQDQAYKQLVFFSPFKTSATHMTTGHSHTGILQGWIRRDPERGSNEVSASVDNTSEHVQMQRYGTIKKGYTYGPRGSVGFGTGPMLSGRPFTYFDRSTGLGISSAMEASGWQFPGHMFFPRLIFWLGPPLKWPVHQARFGKAGFRAMSQVTHPGFGPWGGRDFAEKAADIARPWMKDSLREFGSAVFQPMREFFG